MPNQDHHLQVIQHRKADNDDNQGVPATTATPKNVVENAVVVAGQSGMLTPDWLWPSLMFWSCKLYKDLHTPATRDFVPKRLNNSITLERGPLVSD